MGGYLFFSVFLILLLTLYEKFEIRYVYNRRFELTLSLSVIQIKLWNFKKKNKNKKPLTQRLRRSFAFLDGYRYILAHSEVNVDRIYLSPGGELRTEDAVSYFGSYPILISLFLAYLNEHAMTVTQSENATNIQPGTDPTRASYLSITQKVRVFHLLSGLLIGSINRFKNATKEG